MSESLIRKIDKKDILIIILVLIIALFFGFSMWLNYIPQKSAVDKCDGVGRYYDIQKALEQPEKVCFLQLAGLSEVPPEIGKFKNLRELHITATNHVEVLPPQIGELSNLVILDLMFNRDLKELPPQVFQLSKLEELLLTNNDLTELPSGISALKNLKILRLDNNYLTCLPSEIGELPWLEELYLGGNKLIMLPPEIIKLKNLKVLSIYNNPLVLDQTPIEFLAQRYNADDVKVWREELETFKKSARAGEGITHLAREVINSYLYKIDFFDTNPLTKQQRICLEDHLQNRTGEEWLQPNETRTFSSLLLKEAFSVCGIEIKNICQ